MPKIIEDNDEDQIANRQTKSRFASSSESRELEPQLMETIDNIGDFLHFVDWSSKSEVSAEVSWRDFAPAAVIKPLHADPHADCDHTNDTRRPWRRGLTPLFDLARKAVTEISTRAIVIDQRRLF
jgi:hypothetical protein